MVDLYFLDVLEEFDLTLDDEEDRLFLTEVRWLG
jgi:hypothetical protein